MISNFPTPRNFKLTWHAHNGTSNWHGLSTRVRWYQIFHSLGTSNRFRMFKRVRLSKFLPRWDFKLAWHVHKGKMGSKFYTHGISNWFGEMISNFPLLWNSNLTWHVQKGKKIWNLPPPWNFKLTWHVQKGRTMSWFPPTWSFTLTWNARKGEMTPGFPTPMELQIALECPQE